MLQTLSNNVNNRVQTTPPQVTPTPNNQQGYYPVSYNNGGGMDDEVEYRMAREETASLERRISNAQMR